MLNQQYMKVSIKTMARIGGLLYLVVIIGGLFAEIFVRGRLVVPGDAAATAHNITTHEMLYRCGFAVEVFYCACNIPLILIFYRLFKVVSRDLTLMVVFFSLVGTAIESVSLLAHFAPLVFLGKGDQSFLICRFGFSNMGLALRWYSLAAIASAWAASFSVPAFFQN